METIFITIHDLSLDARIKYCSESIQDILGYKPHEVKGKSCWEYFHPDEIPFARAIHGRGLDLEKAAALNYCRIRHRDGTWIGKGEKAQQRAVDGATVRRVFASSPRDPRYHMLSYISNKFIQKINFTTREPRAALVLNRFTRTSSVMFATNGVEQILGLSSADLVGKSFYYCIAENCLADAVRTLESAKQNDSIAYLRFFFRDPTLPDPPLIQDRLSDTDEDDDEGGVLLSRGSRESSVSTTSTTVMQDVDNIPRVQVNTPPLNGHSTQPRDIRGDSRDNSIGDGIDSRTSSGNSTDMDTNSYDRIFDRPNQVARSSASSITPPNGLTGQSTPNAIEVEAVVSCTSDGLVVVLRRAHPLVPTTATPDSEQPSFPNGLFASPWAPEPILPDDMKQAASVPALQPVTEPIESGFMSAIRDVAVFAWSLTGINGSMIDLAIGTPTGEAIPPGGLPVWDPNAPPGQNDNHNGFSGGTHRPIQGMGEPADQGPLTDTGFSSSDDEVVWKRVPQMPAFKRPKRRVYLDAFGSDGDDSADHSADQLGGVDIQDRRRRKLANGLRHNSSNSS
ncbi:hypothetical protein LTS08_001425 [Lithohypha guttulata]|nr:hypothetical protein LTS08_001425 [Lithohypha guttulata]